MRHLKESIEKWTHAEIGHCGSKEHRSQFPGMNHLWIKFRSGRFQQFHLLDGQIQQVLFHGIPKRRIIKRKTLFAGLLAALGTAEQHNLPRTAIDHATELLSASNGPVHCPWGQPKLRFNFIQKAQRLPTRPIHLVDEGEDRDLAHPANLEQLSGLRLKAFGSVLEHDGVIRRSQGAIGVLRKILVSRCVQQIDRCGVVIELQNGGGDRDTALLFKFHPVGRHLALFPACFHGTRLLNRASIEKKLFGEGCFACVRVGDDREIATAVHSRCHQLALIVLLRCRAARHHLVSVHQA
ncbi:MAG: Uncharacterised protein [Synechococcus sp. CC9902]|nr:MAG: Uncharacterised protein [Synechococcus sp. CC9902]